MIRNDRYPHVFQPLTVRGLTLKNRLEYAPTVVLKCSPEGEVTQEMLDYVAWQAKTGVGYLTIGNTPVVHTDSSAWVCELNVTQDRCIHGLEMMARTARENGAEMSVELAHAGRGSNSTPGNPALAPSDVPLNGGPLGYIKPMNEEDMAYVRQQFVDCAVRCQKAGLKIIMIHCAHNNLLAQFLSPASNHRTDAYGGSLENRMRFPVEVIKALRKAMGEKYLLVVNAPNIGGDMGMDMDEAAEFLRAIDPYIDLLQVRGQHPDHERVTVCESAELSKGLKARGVKTPIAISTYYKDLDSLNNVIASGAADLVAPGHLFICNEHLGEILRDGNGEDLNPCIECHACRGTSSTGDWMSHCTINPEIGMEHRAKRLIEPVTRQKKIALIGGGPGAIKCAMWLKDRGHTPVIFEKSDALGGQIKTAEYPEFKWELKRYLDFLRNQVKRKGIAVRLSTEATPEMIQAEGFDVVIAATGATPKKPDIPGAEHARWDGISIYGNQEQLGHHVVVIGGSSVAAEAACYLAECGHEVTEISRQGRLAYDLNPIRAIGYMNAKADQLGVHVIRKAKTTEIQPNAVTYLDRKGQSHTVSCDDIVACGGMEPNSEAAIAFRFCAPEFYMIGDCRQPGNMRNAIRDAYALAMRI